MEKLKSTKEISKVIINKQNLRSRLKLMKKIIWLNGKKEFK